MSNSIRTKSDDRLHKDLLIKVKQEREIIIEVIQHLREVDRRKLYTEFRCGSLWKYATVKLGYTAHEAQIRISAMRLLTEVPEVEQKLESGEISMTNISYVQTFVKNEQTSTKRKIPTSEKKTLLNDLIGKSTRNAQEILYSRSSVPHIHQETTKRTGDRRIELKFTIDSETELLLAQYKSKQAHLNLSSHEELFKHLLKVANKVKEPKQLGPKKALSPKRTNPKNISIPAQRLPAPAVRTRHIPNQTKKYVFQRDKGHCQKCGSQHAIQFDHIVPYRSGGSHAPINLQLLCRNCNLRKEIAPKNDLFQMDIEDFIRR